MAAPYEQHETCSMSLASPCLRLDISPIEPCDSLITSSFFNSVLDFDRAGGKLRGWITASHSQFRIVKRMLVHGL